MEETHALFKKITFDAWRFKNMILACDEYVVIDSLKRYFVAEGESEGTLADEHILSKIMTIIDAIKIEAEKVYEKKKDENVKHVFLPAMNALMVVVFLSIGTKRVKIHKEKIVTLKAENKKKNEENYEIDGQVKLLDDLRARIIRERSEQGNTKEPVDPSNEYKKQLSAIQDAKKSINQLRQLKNELENNYHNLLRSVAKNLVKPVDLK